jgi:hypothetical protein
VNGNNDRRNCFDEEKRLEIKPIFWAEAPAELRGLFKGV